MVRYMSINVSFNDFCEKIPDLKENIVNGSIKVIPLKKGKKAPRDNGWSKKEYTFCSCKRGQAFL